MTLLDKVVVDDHDAVDGPDEAGERIDRVVNHFRRTEEVPGQNEDRCDSRNEAASTPGDVLRKDVRDVERSRHEVGNDVDADRSSKEREAQQERHPLVVEMPHDLNGIDEHFTKNRRRSGDGDDGDRGEEHEVDR